jgi:hypothetical protein
MSKAVDPNTIVTTARVVAHKTVLGDGSSENHWSIYLLPQPGSTANLSIRMNMRAEYGDTTGKLEWTAHDYTQSTSAVQYWDYLLAAGVTLQMVQNLILQQRS